MGSLVIKDKINGEMALNIDEIKKYLAPTATEQEFWLFINTARALNLNPLKREIYFIKYQDKAQIITGYQVYLERAIRSELLEWWEISIEKPNEKERSTWIGIFRAKRRDWTLPFEWRVPMAEVDKKQATWNLMPEFLLKKNTLSQGLRMLLPEIFSGMPYTAEEISAGTSESIISNEDMPHIEPAIEELEAKERAKNEFLTNLSLELDNITTIKELEASYIKRKKAIEKSELKEEILDLFTKRKKELLPAEIAKQTGYSAEEIEGFIVNYNHEIIQEILEGNEDAIKQFRQEYEKNLIQEK